MPANGLSDDFMYCNNNNLHGSYIKHIGTTVLLMKLNNQAGLAVQCRLVAAGMIVDAESVSAQVKPGPADVTVQVTTVMNTSNPLTEDQQNLHTGELVIWPKKCMAIFQSNPLVVQFSCTSKY